MCASTEKHYYLNIAKTKPSGAAWVNDMLLCVSSGAQPSGDDCLYVYSRTNTHTVTYVRQMGEWETSRTVIRAAWLHLLPGLHLRSIYQLFWLGP